MRPRLDHLEERAELYALGMLEADEFAHVDAHVLRCTECAQRLGRAEAAVAAMADATCARETAPAGMLTRIASAPRVNPVSQIGVARLWRSSTSWAATAAAVFAVASGSLVAQNAALRSRVDSDGAAFHAMVHSHFNHAQFLSVDGTPIDAKVIYERHGGWYEILATSIDANARVAIVHGGVVTESGARFAPRGDVMMVELGALGAVDELRLLDAQGRLLARVHPVLAADPR